MNSHAAVAAVLLASERELPPSSNPDLSPGEDFVARVLDDMDSSALSSAEIQLFHFVDKVNGQSHQISAADMEPLHEAGWTDEQIYFAITVCALFNFFNRWIDASGVPPLSKEAHRQGGKRSAATGYVRK